MTARGSPVDVVVREAALCDGLLGLSHRLPLVTHTGTEFDGLMAARSALAQYLPGCSRAGRRWPGFPPNRPAHATKTCPMAAEIPK